MSRTSRLWKGAGPATVGGLLLFSGALAGGAEPAPLGDQLVGLGRQALDQGRPADAKSFYAKALQLDPRNAAAKRGLADPKIVRLAFRQQEGADKPAPDPAPGAETPPPAADAPAAETPPAPVPAADAPAPADIPPAPGAPPAATLERSDQLDRVLVQRLTAATRERLQRARDLVAAEQPDEALTTLRLALSAVQADDQVAQAVRDALAREVQAAIQSAVRAEESIEAAQVERLRLQQSAAQRARILEDLATQEETVNTLMVQFDALMSQGHYNVLFNGGTGNISAAVAPFDKARVLAQEARAMAPDDPAPRAGVLVAQFEGFLAQSLAFETLKEYRAMMTFQDAERASVPFPDTITIEYPAADFFREITERRTKKYESVDLVARDPKTLAIMTKLDQPISMPFQNETPLEDVIKYIKTATESPALPGGIPIYVDPVGLTEAEKTMTSPVTLNLEGVTLKKGLTLLLKQLGLTYTVKDGLLTITAENSKDQPTEIRVYPVADLSIIPFSLMGGGGMGGMGGGMGGMGGGGMGGMGGGMGGMGGGMGGGGMGGGFRSMPLSDPTAGDAPASPFAEKKSN